MDVDSFATRLICYGFLMHGVLRLGAGVFGKSNTTFAILSSISYGLEAFMFFIEAGYKDTVSDKMLWAPCIVLSILCFVLLYVPGVKAKSKVV